jgi:hypothetical protein
MISMLLSTNNSPIPSSPRTTAARLKIKGIQSDAFFFGRANQPLLPLLLRVEPN